MKTSTSGRTLVSCLLFATLMSLAGCGSVVSIAPPFEAAMEVEDVRVLGDWSTHPDPSAADECCLTVSRADSTYRIESDDPSDGVFSGRLYRVDSNVFLDVWPELNSDGARDLPESLSQVLPLHQTVRLEFMGDSVRTAYLDRDYVLSMIESGVPSTDFVNSRTRLLLIESPKRRSVLMARLATDLEAWEEGVVLYRR